MELIRRHGARSRESLQVAERLKSLLPEVLLAVKRSQAPHSKGADAERKALNDGAYLDKIEEYVTLYAEGWEARIQYETHRMLLEAWRSLNAYQRAYQQVRPKDS
jgi:hypothetical protein